MASRKEGNKTNGQGNVPDQPDRSKLGYHSYRILKADGMPQQKHNGDSQHM
ncbi:MAG TPA: hypothetical protein VF369_09250 [candidate division Zixibacteria bacterium]